MDILVVKACMCPLWRDVTAVERSSVCPVGHWHRSAWSQHVRGLQAASAPRAAPEECLQGCRPQGISGAARPCVLAIKEHLGTDGWTDRHTNRCLHCSVVGTVMRVSIGCWGAEERKLGNALSQGLKRQVNGECAMEGNNNFLLFVPFLKKCLLAYS